MRRRSWVHRIGFGSWVLLWALFASSLSLAIRAFRQARALPRACQVQVLNGSGIPDLGRAAAETLRGRGLDVVSVGNAAASNYLETLVLQRRGPASVARMVVQRLGTGVALQQLDPTLLVDATVLLGRDLLPLLAPGSQPEPGLPAEPASPR